MKRTLLIALSSFLILSAVGCGNSAELEQLKRENEELKAAMNDSQSVSQSADLSESTGSQTVDSDSKSYNVGEPITVQTEYGDYTVSVLSASKAEELNQDGNYPIVVSFEIENLSYNYGNSSDEFLMPWTDSRGGIIVADNEKNILKYYDVLGPKEVHTPKNIPVGYKEKGSYAFFPDTPNVMPASIQVQIGTNNAIIGVVDLPLSE